MKTKVGVLGAVIFALAVFAADAKAQPPQGFGTATITSVTTGTGSITVSGTYTAQCGWSPSSAALYAVPTGGGLITKADAPGAPTCGKWGRSLSNLSTPASILSIWSCT